MAVARIVLATGPFGSGKTAITTWIATQLAREQGCPLWANYSVAGSRPVRSVEELYECRGGVIVLDELQATAHARRATTNANLAYMEWFDQCRKQGSQLFIISQEAGKVDKLIRSMVNFELECENVSDEAALSEVRRYKLHLGRASFLGSFIFPRSLAFGLYDHLERAWGLTVGGDEGPVRVSGGRRAAR